MRRLGIIISFIFFIPALFATPLPQLNPSHPEIYVVKKGDTLWDISAVFLANPWSWPQLWQANDYIKNPHLIYPDDQLHLIWVNGKPKLSLKKHIKLSPKTRIIRQPITVLPDYLMLTYLAQDKLISNTALTNQPQVLGSNDERSYLSVGDIVWADQPLILNSQWRIYRLEQHFKRHDLSQDKNVASIRANISTLKEIADVTVIASNDKTSQLVVNRFQQEIAPNDILLPLLNNDRELDLSFSPMTPSADASATVLGQVSGYNYISNYDVIILDRGHLDGMQAGQVFELFKSGAKVQGKKGQYHYQIDRSLRDSIQLGDIAIAQAMVLRPYEYFSLAVVMKSKMPFKAGVIARAPRS